MSVVISPPPRESASLAALMIWTYRRQRADEMTGRALYGEKGGTPLPPGPSWSLDGCYRIEAEARLGCRIDGGGWQRPAVHPDAEALHDCVVGLSRTDWIGARLLLRYGRQGATPDWHPEPQRLVPWRDARGRPRVVEMERVKVKGRISIVLATALRRDPEDGYITSLRHEYSCWRQALAAIADTLPVLSRWRVTGLGAAAQPWEVPE